jgi:hypothetical protein
MPTLLDRLMPEFEAIPRRDEVGCGRAAPPRGAARRRPRITLSNREKIAEMFGSLDEFARAMLDGKSIAAPAPLIPPKRLGRGLAPVDEPFVLRDQVRE